jgi:hypothetical protein
MGGDMISKWLSAGEIAGLISITKQSVFNRASKERCPFRDERWNGGLRRLYQVETLPEDVQIAYAASLKLSLQRLQSQLSDFDNHLFERMEREVRLIESLNLYADALKKRLACQGRLLRRRGETIEEQQNVIEALENIIFDSGGAA